VHRQTKTACDCLCTLQILRLFSVSRYVSSLSIPKSHHFARLVIEARCLRSRVDIVGHRSASSKARFTTSSLGLKDLGTASTAAIFHDAVDLPTASVQSPRNAPGAWRPRPRAGPRRRSAVVVARRRPSSARRARRRRTRSVDFDDDLDEDEVRQVHVVVSIRGSLLLPSPRPIHPRRDGRLG